MVRMPCDTSGRMHAAGETLTALPVFFLVALVPILLGLWSLRRHTGGAPAGSARQRSDRNQVPESLTGAGRPAGRFRRS